MPEQDSCSALLTPAEAAPLIALRWSKKSKDRVSFFRAVHEWNVPFYRLGPKTIRFTRADLEAWLASRRVGGLPHERH